MQRIATLLKVILLVCAWGAAGFAMVPQYPVIQSWRGQVWLTGKDGKRSFIKKKQVLREKAFIEVALGGEVKVQLDKDRSILLSQSTDILMPAISWDAGEAPVVLLKKGRLHWHQDLAGKSAYSISLSSDLFEFIAPPGDFLLSYDPVNAIAEVKLFVGNLEFGALNGEETVILKSGQWARFQGVLEEGEIAYDVLLKGKKIPRGKLSKAKDIDPDELEKLAEAVVAKKKALALQAAKERRTRARDICQQPAGQFNDCAWICLNNPKKETKKCLLSAPGVSCVRRRCNANGDWAEEVILDAEKASNLCGPKPLVAPCDY